jgi:hypothetical protein
MEQLSSITISPFAPPPGSEGWEHEQKIKKKNLTNATDEEIISEMLKRFVIPAFFTREYIVEKIKELEFDANEDDVDEIHDNLHKHHDVVMARLGSEIARRIVLISPIMNFMSEYIDEIIEKYMEDKKEKEKEKEEEEEKEDEDDDDDDVGCEEEGCNCSADKYISYGCMDMWFCQKHYNHNKDMINCNKDDDEDEEDEEEDDEEEEEEK